MCESRIERYFHDCNAVSALLKQGYYRYQYVKQANANPSTPVQFPTVQMLAATEAMPVLCISDKKTTATTSP
jgi:hypothetical protein